MTSIVIGGIGSAVATGMGRIGIETIPGVIGPDKRFIGHHQDILATEDLMGSQWLEGLEDRMENQVVQGMGGLRVSQVDTGLMEDQVDQGLVARRVGRVVPVEADLTLKCMEDHKAKSVDLDLSPKRLADLVADLRARLVGTLIKKVGKMWLT
jgi:hypothetical protein